MIYCFLAQGFEEVEALAPVDLLRRADFEVKTVGIGSQQITGSHGITVCADITDAQIETDPIEAIILPGGMPGTLNLEKSPIVKACVNYCIDNNLYVCAICAAPSILGHMGLLKGKKATCFPGFEKELTGAQYIDAPTITDGKIITAKSAGAAVEFALNIVKTMSTEEKAAKLRSALQCP